MDTHQKFHLVVMGGSMGSNAVISRILRELPVEYSTPMIIVRHIAHSFRDNFFINSLNENCFLTVKEADQLEPICPRHIYVAPANYHLLVEKDGTLSLSIDESVHYCRPSIDVLFETAAMGYGPRLIGVILTGANKDGALGLKRIKDFGGYTLVQDPETAKASAMPIAAIQCCSADAIDAVLPPDQIAKALVDLTKQKGTGKKH